MLTKIQEKHREKEDKSTTINKKSKEKKVVGGAVV